MLVDGVLCQAGALVNGTTITRVPLSEFGESYTVYHVETDVHEIVLANGAPTETFVDNVSRRAFDNHAEFVKLHGDQPEMKELPHPRASNARHLPARIRGRLGIRSEAGIRREEWKLAGARPRSLHAPAPDSATLFGTLSSWYPASERRSSV